MGIFTPFLFFFFLLLRWRQSSGGLRKFEQRRLDVTFEQKCQTGVTRWWQRANELLLGKLKSSEIYILFEDDFYFSLLRNDQTRAASFVSDQWLFSRRTVISFTRENRCSLLVKWWWQLPRENVRLERIFKYFYLFFFFNTVELAETHSRWIER